MIHRCYDKEGRMRKGLERDSHKIDRRNGIQSRCLGRILIMFHATETLELPTRSIKVKPNTVCV